MIDYSLLERAINKALSLGADYAEARYHSHKTTSFHILNGSVVGASQWVNSGIAVRVRVGKGLGFASTQGVSWNAISDAISRAFHAARSASAKPWLGAEWSDDKLGVARFEVEEKERLEDHDISYKITYVKDELKSIEEPSGIKVDTVLVAYSEDIESKVIVNSDGARIESRIPRLEIFYNLSGRAGDRRANRWSEVGAAGGFEVLRGSNLADKISDDLRSLSVNLLEAKSPPKGRMDVILAPEIVALSAHESAGHPGEADRVYGREAAQAGLSYRVKLGDGYKIGSSVVTVIDDPTIPGSLGYYLYDDEGVPARPRKLIDHGVLAELLHNRETAGFAGVKSNAAARSLDFESEPIVRMANTYVDAGDHTFEELVEDVKDGVYIKKYMEWNIDDYRWIARYTGLEAYLIKNGELKDPVRNVVLEIDTETYYSSMDALGKDLTFFPGTCGKGEPGQPLPVFMGGPHARLRGVMVK